MCWCLIADLITYTGNSYLLKYLLRWGSWKYEVVEVLRVKLCRKRGKIRTNARELDERQILRGTFYFIASVSLCMLVDLTIPLTGSSNTSCNAVSQRTWIQEHLMMKSNWSLLIGNLTPAWTHYQHLKQDSIQNTQVPTHNRNNCEKQDGGRGRLLNTRKTKLHMFLCSKHADVSS